MPNLFGLLRGKRSCYALFTTVWVCVHVHSLVLAPLFPVFHNQLLCLADVKGEVVVLAPHCQVSDLLYIGCLVIVGNQAFYCCVACKFDD